jgi:prevent-host-death family protein
LVRSKTVHEVAISEFKAKCLALLEEVHKTKKALRITRFGKPIAVVIPPTTVQPRDAWIGSMKNSMQIIGDIVSPANDKSDWEVLQD